MLFSGGDYFLASDRKIQCRSSPFGETFHRSENGLKQGFSGPTKLSNSVAKYIDCGQIQIFSVVLSDEQARMLFKLLCCRENKILKLLPIWQQTFLQLVSQWNPPAINQYILAGDVTGRQAAQECT